MTFLHRTISKKQQGAALLVLITLIIAAMSFVLVKALNNNNTNLAGRNVMTATAMGQARDALTGFAASNTDTPGGLPYPDRNGDGNYDGNGDCNNNVLTYDPLQHRIGKWPGNQEVGCGTLQAFGLTPADSQGETLWYAVSGNLLRSTPGSTNGNYPVIHSNIPAGWFTVVNEQGAVLTNRAAAVILAPGGVVQAQTRAGAAAANQFLESAVIGGITYTNFAIEAADTGFVSRIADDTFNDRLIYITVDELMTTVTLRVAQELKQLLDASGAYPATVAGFPGLPAWFTPNWLPVTTYTLDPFITNQATLSFAGCGITYTLNIGSPITQSQPGC